MRHGHPDEPHMSSSIDYFFEYRKHRRKRSKVLVSNGESVASGIGYSYCSSFQGYDKLLSCNQYIPSWIFTRLVLSSFSLIVVLLVLL